MKDTKHLMVKKNIHKLFESSSYLKIIESIKANIRNNTGLIVLTGEPGTGKTLVTRKVIKDLKSVKYTIFLDDPRTLSMKCLALPMNNLELLQRT